MSVFGKLKSLFILEDDDQNAKAAAKAEKELPQETNAEQEAPIATAHDITIDVTNTTPPPSGQPDQKFIDILLKAVEKSNLDGFDYLEYKSSLQNLSKMDMDEATKYKSAFAMATTMGVTSTSLVKTANHYLAVLKQEKGKFQEALKVQKEKQITGKEKSITDMAKAIEAKKKKIEALKKEIENDTQKMQKMKDTISQNVAKVQGTSDNFHYAYNVVTGQILEDVEKMKKYLS